MFFEEGEPMIDGEPGDLVFVVRQVRDARFERRGADLVMNFTISLVDALTGFTHTFEHLDGHVVTLSSNQVTRPGDFQQVRGAPRGAAERVPATAATTNRPACTVRSAAASYQRSAPM